MDVREARAGIICELLEIMIYNILYVRKLYPEVVFQRLKKYNVPVQVVIHPELSQYITAAVLPLKQLLYENAVQEIAVAILHPSLNVPVEKFTLEIVSASHFELGDDELLLKLEQCLRAMCLKINTCSTSLEPLPKGCSWRLQVHAKEFAAIGLMQDKTADDYSWVEADQEEQTVIDPVIVPVKSVQTVIAKMQLYVKESLTYKTK